MMCCRGSTVGQQFWQCISRVRAQLLERAETINTRPLSSFIRKVTILSSHTALLLHVGPVCDFH